MARTRTQPKQPLDHEPEAVAYALQNSGLTKQQLAEMCGVAPSLITEILAGTRNATPIMIGKLAYALNCPRVVLERKREPQTPEAADVDLPGVQGGQRTVAEDVLERQPAPEAATPQEVK